MMVTTVIWIYAEHMKIDPHRCHIAKNRSGFAFSDVRRLITNAALYKDSWTFLQAHAFLGEIHLYRLCCAFRCEFLDS